MQHDLAPGLRGDTQQGSVLTHCVQCFCSAIALSPPVLLHTSAHTFCNWEFVHFSNQLGDRYDCFCKYWVRKVCRLQKTFFAWGTVIILDLSWTSMITSKSMCLPKQLSTETQTEGMNIQREHLNHWVDSITGAP